MNVIEKRIDDLFRYTPELTKQADLEDFWQRALVNVHEAALHSTRTVHPTIIGSVEVFDVNFNGFKETPLHGFLIKPKPSSDAPATSKFPCVVVFHGYQHVRTGPEHYMEWLSLGIAVFAVSVRGQSSGNTLGSEHSMVKGWMTENLLNIEESYYMALAVDHLRALRWVLEQADIDAGKVAVTGGSQGGGLALLAAEFYPQLRAVVADIPNLCHVDYGVFYSQGSLTEIAEFCRKVNTDWQTVLSNLSYFDHLNLADRIQVPIMLSVGLKDLICMPETIFPVYNRIASQEKSLEIYPFTGHAIEYAQKKKGMAFIYKHLIEK